MIHAIAQGHHGRGCAGRSEQFGSLGPGIGMRALGRPRLRRGVRTGRVGCAGTGHRLAVGIGAAAIDDTIDSAGYIVGYIEAAVRSDRQSAGTMCSLARRFIGAGKSIGKYFALARRLLARQRLIDDVVTALRVRGAIPRTMEGDEESLPVVSWELLLVVEHHAVGRPVSREVRGRRNFLRARAGGFSISAIFRREHQPR